MPITRQQKEIGLLLAANRTVESYLAGAVPLLVAPEALRYSRDLDYFHDSEQRVAESFASDRAVLTAAGFTIKIEINQPGFIRVTAGRDGLATRIDWARDSLWRFLPVERSVEFGFQLHPVDLAINKVLALAGRDEPRDLLDTLYCHQHILSLGSLCWAAVGKDPGYSPRSLLEMLRRRGVIRTEDLARLDLTTVPDLLEIRETWNNALAAAESVQSRRPAAEAGCLYFHTRLQQFVDLESWSERTEIAPHFGSPGGVFPRIGD